MDIYWVTTTGPKSDKVCLCVGDRVLTYYNRDHQTGECKLYRGKERVTEEVARSAATEAAKSFINAKIEELR